MPQISTKGKAMPASPIRKLTPYAETAKAEGTKVFHLNIGQPDIKTPENVLQAIKNIDFSVWAYTLSEGTASYREALARYYNANGYNVTPHDIIVTMGGSEALQVAMQCCLNEGDEIIIPEPFYANYNSFATSANVKVVPVPAKFEDDFALPPVTEIAARITSRTRAILICNPGNPTGYLYTKHEIEQLLELCVQHDLFLVSDEAYREFCYDGRQFVSPLHKEYANDNVIVIDTVSKRYSACGARLGCLITKNEDVLSAALKFAQARLCAGMVEQIACTAAVDTPEEYFTEVRQEYTLRRDILVKRLRAMPGVKAAIPGGAFYVMAALPVQDAEEFCRWMLEKYRLNNSTVMMAPGSGFYSSPGQGVNQVRLAYVLNVDDINAAMDCLEHGLSEYNKQSGTQIA